MDKITVKRTKSSVIDQMKRAILQGEFEPGQELVQEDLADRLQVSRTPIRETLHALEDEGFVQRLPNRHVQIAQFDAGANRDIVSMICVIEQELLRLQTKKGSGWLPGFQACAAAFSRTPCTETSIALHMSLSENLENLYLRKLHLRLVRGYFRYILEAIPAQAPAAGEALAAFAARVCAGDAEGACGDLDTYFDLIRQQL